MFLLLAALGFAIILIFSEYGSFPKKQTEVSSIVAFGDSLTYGYGDHQAGGYISVLKQRLNENNEERIYTFKNNGVYGLESSGVLKQFAEPIVISEINEANYLIVFIGTMT